ncbi:allantoinase AllB [Candidatus Bathyarchaeota archaeon]|nr:allantoinase AllB [Candidatus Bathyarchaeota archaeon]
MLLVYKLTVDLVIKNGLMVLSNGLTIGSVIVDNGSIIGLVKTGEPPADKVVDASNKLVLPGMIDMHVHLRDPGFPERENFESGTSAAAAGGVTTVIDMPNTIPATVTAEAFKEKQSLADRKSLIDFAFFGGAGEIPEKNLHDMAELGATGFKSFLIARFKELAASDYTLLKHMRTLSELDLPLLVHAENGDIVDKCMEEAKKSGRTDPTAHCDFREPIAEIEATMRCILFAEEAGAHLHLCHMTAAGAVDILEWAQNKGQMVTGETSTNYLLFTRETMVERGPYAKVDPPLRGKEDQMRLWDALNDGTLDVLASDHAPYTKEEKERGWENIFEAPSGGVVVETTLPLMLDAVNNDRISIERLVEVFSRNPAQINGFYPKKGDLMPGADADIVIVDMKKPFHIRGEDLHTIQKITPYEDMKGKGMPVMTFVRGELIYEEGEVVGKPGYGEFQRPC